LRLSRPPQQRCQSLAGIGPVALLAAEALRDNHDLPLARQAAPGEAGDALLDLRRQRRRAEEVEAQLDGARQFIDVLATRAGGADEVLFEFAVVDAQVRRNRQHNQSCAKEPANMPNS